MSLQPLVLVNLEYRDLEEVVKLTQALKDVISALDVQNHERQQETRNLQNVDGNGC